MSLLLLLLSVHGLPQHRHALRVVRLVRQVEGCEAQGILGQQVGPGIHQSLDVADMSVLCSDVQGRPVLSPGPACSVGAGPRLNQDPQTQRTLGGGGRVDGAPAPAVTAVDVLQLLFRCCSRS